MFSFLTIGIIHYYGNSQRQDSFLRKERGVFMKYYLRIMSHIPQLQEFNVYPKFGGLY